MRGGGDEPASGQDLVDRRGGRSVSELLAQMAGQGDGAGVEALLEQLFAQLDDPLPDCGR